MTPNLFLRFFPSLCAQSASSYLWSWTSYLAISADSSLPAWFESQLCHFTGYSEVTQPLCLAVLIWAVSTHSIGFWEDEGTT